VKAYDVPAVRPVLENDVVAVVPTAVPFLKMRYPVTPTLSVDALQLRSICVAETAVAERFAGTLGAVVSATLNVFAETAADCADSLLAASYAETVKEYDVPAVRPVFE
jgi:hypothetical protein